MKKENILKNKPEYVILKKDIVIPAGTLFSAAPSKTVRYGRGHYQTVFAVGNSKDTSGTITYFIDDSVDSDEEDLMNEYFSEIEEG